MIKTFGKLLASSLAAAVVVIALPAYAFPKQWVATTYYADAALSTEVGHREVTCHGSVESWGIVTQYYVRIVFDDDCGS